MENEFRYPYATSPLVNGGFINRLLGLMAYVLLEYAGFRSKFGEILCVAIVVSLYRCRWARK